jgi:DNA polymerase-3 subunit alpha/error-prone DNA polymerase
VEFKYRSIFQSVFWSAKRGIGSVGQNPMQLKNPIVKLVQEYGMLLEKYPNQRNSCGIIISKNPSPIIPLEMPPKGFPIVLFDMHVAEDIGFENLTF